MMDIRGFLWQRVRSVSWRHPLFRWVSPGLDAADAVTRKLNGLSRLPNYSVRIRSNGFEKQFGGRAFLQRGETVARLLAEHAGLKPKDRVFEIGCGAGSAAFALVPRLERGMYTGADIDKPSIDACLASPLLTERDFRFTWIDVHHPFYNPSGTKDAGTYRFPWPDGGADVIFLVSVFTHLLAGDTANYVREIGRLLAPGGRCLFTTFLMDHGFDGYIAFPVERGECRISQEQNPEKAVGYHSRYWNDRFAGHGMRPAQAPLLGQWRFASGPKPTVDFGQDVMVFEKPRS
jgi:SAM-dependent methyltransferase